mmetsp:Transcript_13294/g.31626  ORF Transcript_13294/g.31626 Transcript_13294/m.31626 type:complete len:120 (+) Transcript_13294:1009-1368(+)
MRRLRSRRKLGRNAAAVVSSWRIHLNDCRYRSVLQDEHLRSHCVPVEVDEFGDIAAARRYTRKARVCNSPKYFLGITPSSWPTCFLTWWLRLGKAPAVFAVCSDLEIHYIGVQLFFTML